jgi:NADH:ubiquinone oxidoreductase subunit 3 (subunit A)
MLYNYLALVFFVAFGLFIPASYLFLSRLLRNRESGNPVKNAPFESAEESLGGDRGIMHEYLPYFMLFLPFEIVLVMLFLWSTASRIMPTNASIAIMILVAVAAAFSIFGYKLAGGRNGR